jgi:type VI secretion system secreted protein Hcp
MAQANYFLKIDGIDGSSEAKGYEKQIELDSWQWGSANAAEMGAGTGHVVMQDVTVSTQDGKAAALLMLSCAIGKQIPGALLTCRQATGKQDEFLKIKLSNVFVSSFQNGGTSEDTMYPTAHLTLNFNKIEYAQAPVTKDKGVGTFDTHWYDIGKQDGK